MAGAVVIVIVLLLIPVLVLLGSALIAAVLGQVLEGDAAMRNEGSELSELAD